MLNTTKSPKSNFSVFVKSVTVAENVLRGGSQKFIDLELHFADSDSRTKVTVPLQDLKGINWEDIDIRCQYNPTYSPAKIKREIANKIRAEISKGNVKQITSFVFEKTGMYKIKDVPVFCVGNEVICPSSLDRALINFDTSSMLEHLDIDTCLSEKDAIEQMLGLISLCPVPGMIILSQMVVYFLRQIFNEVGVKPCVCVFLFGKTGGKKTTFSSFLTQIYNRKSGVKNPIRLNASIPAAVNLLSETRDGVTVFDDLFPADSNNIRSRQEETLGEIVRFVGDGTVPAKMRGKTLQTFEPECGVLFTGEYLIGEGSDAARIFPVQMQNIDDEKLRYFQKNPLIVSTFYFHLISWIVENYDNILGFLKDKDVEYNKTNLGIHNRLKRTLYFLDSSFGCVMCYCVDKGYFSEEEAEKIQRVFQELILDVALKQETRISRKTLEVASTDNYLAHIISSYNNGNIHYANNCDEYIDGVHDGVVYGGCLCLRGEWFSKVFKNVPLSKISDSLTVQGALIRGKNASKQISRLKGKRFYFIPLSALNNNT